MVTVALEMCIIMQGGVRSQAAGVAIPYPRPQELAPLHPMSSSHTSTSLPTSLRHACALTPPGLGWCGLGLSPPRAGEGRESGCSHPFPAELIADDASGGAAHQWELCVGHKWAVGGMGPLGWVGCVPPVSWPGKLQADKAEGSPNCSPLPAFLRWKQQ